MATTAERRRDDATVAFAGEWVEASSRSDPDAARLVAAAVDRDLAGQRIALAANYSFRDAAGGEFPPDRLVAVDGLACVVAVSEPERVPAMFPSAR